MASFNIYTTIDYLFNKFGYTKAAGLDIVKGEPITDDDIERIDINFARKTREVIRWLDANGTDVGAMVNSDIFGIIGSGVNIQSRIKDESELNESIEDYIDLWSDSCDVSGRWHFNEALRTMVRFNVKDGGFLLRHHVNKDWATPYKFELIEVGMIDISKDDKDKNLLNGLQKDKYGAITGVWIYTDQDRDKSTLIDYSELIFYSPVWISLSQYTAVSKLSSILPTIDKMDRYTDAELQKVIEDAKAGRYWKTAMYDDIMKIVKATKDETTRKVQLNTLMKKIGETGIKPSGLTAIPLGDDIVKTENLSASIYPNLDKALKRNMSASQGKAGQVVYQDASDSNYSSIKAMMAFAQIKWNSDFDDLYNRVIKPILKRVVMSGVDTNQIKISDFYTNTRKYLKFEIMRVTEIDIEPSKTAQADEKKLANGTSSKREICRRRGRNYEDVLREILEDEQLETTMREEMKLPVEKDDDIID